MTTQTTYSQALKKNFAYSVFFIIVVLVSGIVLYPVNTPIKYALFSVFSLSAGALSIVAIKQSNKKLACKSCSANIYFFAEQAKHNKIAINYCPVCGAKIEV